MGFRDELPYEVWNGERYEMFTSTLAHSDVAGAISCLFGNYFKANGMPCKVFMFRAGVRFEDENTIVLPDVKVVCDKAKIGKMYIEGAPDLIVEILDPSSELHDRKRKKDLYERQGVKEYWIVSVGDKTIEQYILDGNKYDLAAVYHRPADWELEDIARGERAEVTTKFKTSIFEDLVIDLHEVFEGGDSEWQ